MTRKSKQPHRQNGYHVTENENIVVDLLEMFIRVNKYIGEYKVHVKNNAVPDGTRVTISAYSLKTGNAELKNNVSYVWHGVAIFQDLRFESGSGRGTKFDVFFEFSTCKPFQVSYKNAIKVSVDGPRPPRYPNATTKSILSNLEDESSSTDRTHKRKISKHRLEKAQKILKYTREEDEQQQQKVPQNGLASTQPIIENIVPGSPKSTCSCSSQSIISDSICSSPAVVNSQTTWLESKVELHCNSSSSNILVKSNKLELINDEVALTDNNTDYCKECYYNCLSSDVLYSTNKHNPIEHSNKSFNNKIEQQQQQQHQQHNNNEIASSLHARYSNDSSFNIENILVSTLSNKSNLELSSSFDSSSSSSSSTSTSLNSEYFRVYKLLFQYHYQQILYQIQNAKN